MNDRHRKFRTIDQSLYRHFGTLRPRFKRFGRTFPVRFTESIGSVGVFHVLHRESSTSLRSTYFGWSARWITLGRLMFIIARSTPFQTFTKFQPFRRIVRFPNDFNFFRLDSTFERSFRIVGFLIVVWSRFKRFMLGRTIVFDEGSIITN